MRSLVMMRIGTTRTQSLQLERIPNVSFHSRFNYFSAFLHQCRLVPSVTKFLRLISFHCCGRKRKLLLSIALNDEEGRRISSMVTLLSLHLRLLGEVLIMDEAIGLQNSKPIIKHVGKARRKH
ncbi:hypothetical protein V6N13_081809 [Hibiscus sabdariffa]